MKNSEQAMEALLAGLRDAEAPAGMERRILKAVEDCRSARSRSSWRRLRPAWLRTPTRPAAAPPWAWGVEFGFGLAGTVAVVLAVALAVSKSVSQPHPIVHGSAEPKQRPRPSEARAAAARAAAVQTAVQVAVEEHAQPLPARFLVGATEKRGRTNARPVAILSDSDSIALSEMRAASRPAPPEPLSRQEKLLLQIAHQGDPKELVKLDPASWAAQVAEEDMEFQKFFATSTRGDHE